MKKVLFVILSPILFLFLTGCFKKDDLENIVIYTTAYPIEYITNTLYGEHSDVKSIYPDGTDINKYSLTDKQINDYGKGNMFVFNGLGTEQTYVAPLFKKNKDLMIIDATQNMEYTYDDTELWLNPSNLLMLSLNIKNGLLEYIENHYLKEEIEKNYDSLKIQISNIDAKLKLMSENASHTTIVVDNDGLKFLEKYGFTVISLQDNNGVSEKNLRETENLIKNKEIKYIFTLSGTEVNETVSNLVKTTKVQLLTIYNLANITDKQRSENEDYFSIMNENMEIFSDLENHCERSHEKWMKN